MRLKDSACFSESFVWVVDEPHPGCVGQTDSGFRRRQEGRRVLETRSRMKNVGFLARVWKV